MITQTRTASSKDRGERKVEKCEMSVTTREIVSKAKYLKGLDKIIPIRVWGHRSVILPVGSLRQKDHKRDVSLVYIVSSRLVYYVAQKQSK